MKECENKKFDARLRKREERKWQKIDLYKNTADIYIMSL